MTNESVKWIDRYDGGPHEANFLKLDCSKLKGQIGWKPKWHIGQAVEKTVEWARVYQSHGDVRACMEQQIKEFMAEEQRI